MQLRWATRGGACVRHVLWLLTLVVLLGPARETRADETTGTWTGSLNGDLNYYYERSTRVYLPTGGIKLESPIGIRMRADYLLDVITSASVGAGRTEDVAHDERRHQWQAGVGYGFDVAGGDAHVEIDATGRMSNESDYESRSVSVDGAVELNEKNTVLRSSLTRLVDEIRSNSDATFEGTLKAWTVTFGLEQILNPYMVLSVGYQFGHQWGYLGNPYRFAQREAAPEREAPPRRKVRHGFSGRLASHIPAWDLSVHAMMRAYFDTWEVRAMAPELRIYREFADLLLVRLRYRFYTQTRAWFFRETYARAWDGPITSDPKQANFDSHTIGIRFDLSTAFLYDTFLDFASDSTIYLQLDRVITGIRYGDQVTGTGGAIWRF